MIYNIEFLLKNVFTQYFFFSRYNETKSSPSGFTKDKCRERNEHVYFGGHFNPIHVIGSLSKIGFSGCLQHIYYNDVSEIAFVVAK